jgi:hypothetical protein
MKDEQLNTITETVEGYHVKNLTWIARDGVIRGQVKCPVRGSETLHEGYVIATWRKSGKLMPKWGDRKDLNLKIN